jgi:hypothetical protein
MSAAKANKVNFTAHVVKVAQALHEAGVKGATDEELEDILGMKHQTVSARRRDLVISGLAAQSGRRRYTRSGATAQVWIWVPEDWVGGGRVLELVRQAAAARVKNKRARGGRHPLDMWGMVRVAREAFGQSPGEDFEWLREEDNEAILQRLRHEVEEIEEAMKEQERSEFQIALSRLVYSALSSAWAHGMDFPSAFNDLHRFYMGQAVRAAHAPEQDKNTEPEPS